MYITSMAQRKHLPNELVINNLDGFLLTPNMRKFIQDTQNETNHPSFLDDPRIFIALAILTTLLYYPTATIISAIAFCAGYVLHESKSLEEKVLVTETSQEQFKCRKKSAIQKLKLLPKTHPLYKPIKRLNTFIIRDFIESWYSVINVSGNNEFQKSVEVALEQLFCNLGQRLSRLNPAQIIVTITHTLSKHINEYRCFESTKLSLEDYISLHPNSILGAYRNKYTVIEQCRQISLKLLNCLLTESDASCRPLVNLLQEILSSTILLPVLENKLGNVDYINSILYEAITQKRDAVLDDEVTESVVSFESTATILKQALSNNEELQLFLKVEEGTGFKRFSEISNNGKRIFLNFVLENRTDSSLYQSKNTLQIPISKKIIWDEDLKLYIRILSN